MLIPVDEEDATKGLVFTTGIKVTKVKNEEDKQDDIQEDDVEIEDADVEHSYKEAHAKDEITRTVRTI